MHPNIDPPNKNEHHDLVSALVDVGSAWARYGLEIGKLALETSARTLGTTANALGTIAKNLEPADDDKNVVDTTAR